MAPFFWKNNRFNVFQLNTLNQLSVHRQQTPNKQLQGSWQTICRLTLDRLALEWQPFYTSLHTFKRHSQRPMLPRILKLQSRPHPHVKYDCDLPTLPPLAKGYIQLLACRVNPTHQAPTRHLVKNIIVSDICTRHIVQRIVLSQKKPPMVSTFAHSPQTNMSNNKIYKDILIIIHK